MGSILQIWYGGRSLAVSWIKVLFAPRTCSKDSSTETEQQSKWIEY